MPRPLPDPSPGATARLREAAEQLRAVPTDARGGSAATDLESWTLARLRRRATELGVEGRSAMDKAELVASLRALLPGSGDAEGHDR